MGSSSGWNPEVKIEKVHAQVLRTGGKDIQIQKVHGQVLRTGAKDMRVQKVHGQALRLPAVIEVNLDKLTLTHATKPLTVSLRPQGEVWLNKLGIVHALKDGVYAIGTGDALVDLDKLDLSHQIKYRLDAYNPSIGVPVVGGPSGKFGLKMIMLRDDISEDDMPTVTEHQMLDTPSIKEGTWLGTLNDIKVQYCKRFVLYFGPVRITQEVLEVLRHGLSNVRVTQEAIEVLRHGLSKGRITQEVVEVLVGVSTDSSSTLPPVDSSSSAPPIGDSSSSGLPPGDSSSSAPPGGDSSSSALPPGDSSSSAPPEECTADDLELKDGTCLTLKDGTSLKLKG